MIDVLIDALRALARLMEAESEALVHGEMPDTLGTLAAAKSRVLIDLDRLEAIISDVELAGAIAALRDAATVHAAVFRDCAIEKFWLSKPKRLRRV